MYTLLAVSCDDDKIYTPKPRMYPKIDFPEKGVKSFDQTSCPFTFEYPQYATILQDQYIFEGEIQDPCWFNVHMPALNGTLHCSYVSIDDEEEFYKVIRDAFKIVSKHNVKANYREENLINNEQGVTGLEFAIKGPVATPYQFYVTDTTNHFFRASLYFNAQVSPDSMAPIHQFVIEDLQHMIETFNWK